MKGCFSLTRFKFTFPDGDGMPSHRSEFLLNNVVALLVTPNLRHPVRTVRLRNLATLGILDMKGLLYPILDNSIGIRRAFKRFNMSIEDFFVFYFVRIDAVSMPETSINENARAVFPQHNVGFAGQSGMIKTISQTMVPQKLAHKNLGLRVFGPNPGHVVMPLFYGKFIGHADITNLSSVYSY